MFFGKAKEFLSQRGVVFTEKDITKDPSAVEVKDALKKGEITVELCGPYLFRRSSRSRSWLSPIGPKIQIKKGG